MGQEFLVGLRGGPEARTEHLFGLGALAAELTSEGKNPGLMFAGTSLSLADLSRPDARMSRRERLAIYDNVKRLSSRPDVALRAGARQQIGDFGMFGFGLSAQPRMEDGWRFMMRHVPLLGPVMLIRYSEGSREIVMRTERPEAGRAQMPFVIEFWRSSIITLFERAMKLPFRSKRMKCAFPAPPHAHQYEQQFGCPVEFDATHTEWHLDLDDRDMACTSHNAVSAEICEAWCRSAVPDAASLSFVERIRVECSSGDVPGAEMMAERLDMSLRTFFRRLREEGASYQTLVDDARRTRAIALLEASSLTVDEIGAELGFSDATNFRKAFRRWTGSAPSAYRAGTIRPPARHD